MEGQPNLMCMACYCGALEGIICAAGYKPDTCKHFIQAYYCKGRLVYDYPVTKKECAKCAKTCSSCKKGR